MCGEDALMISKYPVMKRKQLLARSRVGDSCSSYACTRHKIITSVKWNELYCTCTRRKIILGVWVSLVKVRKGKIRDTYTSVKWNELRVQGVGRGVLVLHSLGQAQSAQTMCTVVW